MPIPEIEDLNPTPIGPGAYAPKKRYPDLDKLEAEVARSTYSYSAGNESVNQIKDHIKKLTHRQMREMVKAIFEAKAKIGTEPGGDAITLIQMPDVLDRFAHGD